MGFMDFGLLGDELDESYEEGTAIIVTFDPSQYASLEHNGRVEYGPKVLERTVFEGGKPLLAFIDSFQDIPMQGASYLYIVGTESKEGQSLDDFETRLAMRRSLLSEAEKAHNYFEGEYTIRSPAYGNHRHVVPFVICQTETENQENSNGVLEGTLHVGEDSSEVYGHMFDGKMEFLSVHKQNIAPHSTHQVVEHSLNAFLPSEIDDLFGHFRINPPGIEHKATSRGQYYAGSWFFTSGEEGDPISKPQRVLGLFKVFAEEFNP